MYPFHLLKTDWEQFRLSRLDKMLFLSTLFDFPFDCSLLCDKLITTKGLNVFTSPISYFVKKTQILQ